MILSNLIEKQRLNRIIYYSVSKGNFFFILVNLYKEHIYLKSR